MKFRILIIILVMLLSLYPVGELTRCIVVYNLNAGPAAGWDGHVITSFYLELALIWGAYMLIPLILTIAFKLIYSMGTKGNKRREE